MPSSTPCKFGSSPRMRGAQSLLYHSVTVGRIIPADAGSTRINARFVMECGDHPRGCGEHLLGSAPPLLRLGSSPRMRGAPRVAVLVVGLRGIIPADAGSTYKDGKVNGEKQDHPHGCGKHVRSCESSMTCMGSSPRMRGAHSGVHFSTPLRRIIPADAGSTRGLVAVGSALRDHPRGCGEHARMTTATRPARGSSPRMRGALVDYGHDLVIPGIIPADAGSTWRAGGDEEKYRDHPRGCGEHAGRLSTRSWVLGSSPRMRGAHQGTVAGPQCRGIIPADAGSTC